MASVFVFSFAFAGSASLILIIAIAIAIDIDIAIAIAIVTRFFMTWSHNIIAWINSNCCRLRDSLYKWIYLDRFNRC